MTGRMDWELERIRAEFGVPEEALAGFEVVAAWDDSGSYSTDFWALLRKEGKLYEISCSTCSCYGCDGQFSPEEVTADQLAFRWASKMTDERRGLLDCLKTAVQP